MLKRNTTDTIKYNKIEKKVIFKCDKEDNFIKNI